MTCTLNATGPEQDVLKMVGKSFTGVASRMKRTKNISDKFLVLPEYLPEALSKIQASHPNIHSDWITAVAKASGTIGESLNKLRGERLFDATDISVFLDLAHGLDQLSFLMGKGVESCTAPAIDPELPPNDREKLDQLIDSLIPITTSSAFEFYIAAKNIALAAGVDGMFGAPSFQPPNKGRKRSTRPILVPESPQVELPSNAITVVGYDEKELAKALEKVAELVRLFVAYLLALGQFFTVIPAFISCYNECPLWSEWQLPPKLTNHGAEQAPGGGYVSWFELTWEYCAYDWCWILWWDSWIIEVKTKHKVNGVVNQAGRKNKAIAERQAASTGRRAVASFGPGPPTTPPNVTPPVTLPPVPNW